MSTILRLTADEYDSMIAKGAFDGVRRKIELIRGELREMNPAGPVHEDYIDYLTRWSVGSTNASECVVRVQSSIDLDDSRPEPDITWLKPGRYAERRPQSDDVLLLIEVADSSLSDDRTEKAELYAQWNIAEYWIVNVQGRLIHAFRDSDGSRYQSVEQYAATQTIAPQCKPSAVLELQQLFVA